MKDLLIGSAAVLLAFAGFFTYLIKTADYDPNEPYNDPKAKKEAEND